MLQKSIIIDNLKINYYQSENFNKDNVLVYLHGWGSEALHFKNILKVCHNFIALDLPGFGKSDLPDRSWAIKDYADFLKNFLEKLGIEKPILAGHSFGGSVLIKYSALGNNAKKIILIASSGVRQKQPRINFYIFMAKLGKFFFSLPWLNLVQGKARRKFHKVVDAADFSNLTAGSLKETFKNIIIEDLRGDMEKIKVNTAIIWGENDLTTPLKDGLIMNESIKNSKMHIIKSAGHYVFADQEDKFKEIFLNEINAG